MSPASPYLTREKINRIFEDNGPVLLSMIRIDAMFLASLVQERAITSLESEDIQAIELPSTAKQKLFEIIKSKDENFLSFCIILYRKFKRDDIIRDQFHLNIRSLELQKKAIEERREKEVEENKRLDELERQKQSQPPLKKRQKQQKEEEERTAEPSTTEEIVEPQEKEELVNKRLHEVENGGQTHRTTEPSTTDTCDQLHTDAPTTVYKPLRYRDVTKLLTDHKTAFYDRFDPTNRVLAELKKVKVITADTENKLNATAITPDDRKNVILDTVGKRGVKVFLDFCLVLCQEDISQDDLVIEVLALNIDDIRKQRASVNTTDIHKQKDPPTTLAYRDIKKLLTDHKTEFYNRFEPTYRVLAELKKAKVIAADTENKLNASTITPDERKNTILETVGKRGVEAFLAFCLVLCQEDILQNDLVTEVLGLNIDDIRNQSTSPNST